MKKNNFLVLGFVTALLCSSCSQVEREDRVQAEQEGRAQTNAPNQQSEKQRQKNIIFFGNSLTAGYGLEPDQAFPALIQERIDSLDLPYRVVNAGVSGETSAGGKSRVDWLLRQPVDVFVLELGANDGLRGIAPSDTYANLQSIIQQVRAKYPEAEIILAGMQLPPSMGQQYTQEFREVYIRLAEDENVRLIPFLLEGVGGIPKLNQKDGIHPTEEGQKILAQNTWAVLEPILREDS
ncbi:arylesterase [Pontibacter sp. SGAir0037]|uniref:arylesterase n=1 Tax=Pontibacter sp. SGAir0037 TaxID=2571030 RepID=UPI0010CCBA29|nr:arylesterase [Pontibacter sp. SGAir0037]QCR21933.1 arylesterase [Pontibacter sp. SGAir0037]